HRHIVDAVARSEHATAGRGLDSDADHFEFGVDEGDMGAVMAVICASATAIVRRRRTAIVIDIVLDKTGLADRAIDRPGQRNPLLAPRGVDRKGSAANTQDSPGEPVFHLHSAEAFLSLALDIMPDFPKLDPSARSSIDAT